MASYNIQKLVKQWPELDKLLDRYSNAGVDMIELRWREIRHSWPDIVGVDVPDVKSSTQIGSSDVDYNVSWNKDGRLKFYPDQDGRCWAVLADTKRNREWLARTLKSGWFTIVDPRVRSEIINLAESMNESTEIARDKSIDAYLDSKKEKEQLKIEELEAEKKRLTAELEQLRKSKEEIEEKSAPLRGIRIDKSKLG